MGLLDYFTSDDSNTPKEDQHEDKNASVGDIRICVLPMGELFGYDSEVSKGKLIVQREEYKSTATYTSGAKYYKWTSDRTLFQGTPEEWRDIRKNPEYQFKDIPANWDAIVEHVDQFLEVHENRLSTKEYPDSRMEI